ncbi:hypothetical protein [Bacillus sp. 7884-1]|uniref:hypothetical protein n=1 Tax=Bacillus sp. 7884-1 TaxID=2021693 RepID=UPI000BA68A7E|nr:hypothetical protein [Bacillus sp. 7884-1]PAE35419.1 hypothetical protein CHI06_23500 [Bacillus sp. 7884-1]
METLNLMVGLSCSGKTTFIRKSKRDTLHFALLPMNDTSVYLGMISGITWRNQTKQSMVLDMMQCLAR